MMMTAMSETTVLMVLVLLMVVTCGPAVQAKPSDKRFKENATLREPVTGQRFELHSEGTMAQLVDLDRIPEVTRMACIGDCLMLRMTDTGPALGWTAGQVVVGGLGWGCNATRHNGFSPHAIYVKLVNVTFPLDNEVILLHVQAGPFDMLEEASIHFHYDPGKKTHPALSAAKMAAKRSRFRRSLSNLVSNVLNHVDWQASLSTSIPFNLGLGSDNSSDEEEPRSIALHKSWGQRNLSLTRGQRAEEVRDDFVLYLDKLSGNSELTYTFDLVIENVDGDPKVVKYINQYDLQANPEATAEVSFRQEMGVTFTNVTVGSSPTTELLRVPLLTFRGSDPPLPPVYLNVSYRAVSQASVSAYSADRSSLTTAFSATGFVTASQQFDPETKVESEARSRNWSMDVPAQNLSSPHRAYVDFSIYQKLFFTSVVSWHYRDVDIELSPPMEITVLPEVQIRSSSPGVSRCVSGAVNISAHIHAGDARFTADAFGLYLWNVPLQPDMTRDLHLIQSDLGQGCVARCHLSQYVIHEALNTSQQVKAIGRHDQEFSRFQAFGGYQVVFHDDAANATWCGQPGTPCYNCSQHAIGDSANVTCASRLMTSRAAAALTLLADLASAEWPDKQVLVLEAWDEPTSEHPSGQHEDQPLYGVGRALTLGLADRQDQQEVELGDVGSLLDRFAQLAQCAGFELLGPLVNNTPIQVGVAEDGWAPSDTDLESQRSTFWEVMDNLDISDLSAECSTAPRLSEGDTWPQHVGDPARKCGPADTALHRGDRVHMSTLVHWNLTNAASLTFEAEGQATEWCGYPSRPCRDECDTLSINLEPWNWCGTRMMTPRLALRLRRLQKLAAERNMKVHVLQAFTETALHSNASVTLYHEGRAVKLNTTPTGQLGELASLAVCAGFDVVSFSSSGFLEAFVKKQAGFRTVLNSFFEGPSHATVTAVGVSDDEYSYPLSLRDEEVISALLDGGLEPDTPLSQHFRLRDVISSQGRYFRLDSFLLECLELAGEDFDGSIEMIQDSVYRPRSENVRRNLDLRHPQELWRFQTGQALEILPAGNFSSERLLALATSILRECPPLVRLQMRAVGIGCHSDRLYVDLRPVVEGNEQVYVMVWDGEGEEGDTGYCQQVQDMQRAMINGDIVMQSDPDIACRDRQLDPGLEFLSFQMGQHCSLEEDEQQNQMTFCQHSQEDRSRAADDLKMRLVSAAGDGRMEQHILQPNLQACLVDLCGGCSGVGPVFDNKVRACSRLVRYYVDRAASPLPPDLTDITAFYNLDSPQPTVQALACTSRSICVPLTSLYSLFAPTATARYYPDPTKSLQRALFASDVNPTPLLELVSQEIAFRAKGNVTVYIRAETDIYALRNILKVLMVYNKNVTIVEFRITIDVDMDLVTSTIQRKQEVWSGVACTRFARFALTPFRVVTLEAERQRRSAEESIPGNRATAEFYNWEQDWLDKMF